MDIRQCKRCNKIYNYYGNPKCPECLHELDDIFVKVRDLLYKNPNTGIDELCDETGAEPGDVAGWLREGRLILGGDSAKLLTCQACGTPIHAGRYCDRCSGNLAKKIGDSVSTLAPSRVAPKDYTSDKKSGMGIHVDLEHRK